MRSAWPLAPGWLAGPLAMALTCTAYGQTASGAVSGHVTAGFRSVDADGAISKFREDVNLEDGARLFDAAVSYRPDAGQNALVDQLDFRAEGLGGDPYASLRLSMRKNGSYEFDLNRVQSKYFYADTITPAELASVSGSTGGDLHRFDFERTRDTARLEWLISPATTVDFGLEHLARKGDSTTTLALERDEFELEQPLDESLRILSAGVQHRWDKMTLLFEQQFGEFDNTRQLFLPGASAGRNPADLAELTVFTADQSYDYRSSGQLLRLLGRPHDRIDVLATWRREALDLDMSLLQQARGTGFAGNPLADNDRGAGAIERNIDLYGLDIGFALRPRVRLVGAFRQSKLSQTGQVDFMEDPGRGLWDISTTGAELGTEIAVTPGIVLSFGLSDETRDAIDSHVFEAEQDSRRVDTGRRGYFSRISARLGMGLDINASIEDDAIDDAYTLAAPTDSRRYRLRLRQRWANGVSVAVSFRETTLDNAVSGFSGVTTQSDARISFNGERFEVGGGIALIDLTRDIAQLVTAGTRQDVFLIDYDADITARDLSVRWRVSDRLAIGSRFYRYDNDGSFAIRQDDQRLFVDVDLSDRYLLHASLRRIESCEQVFDDYEADLLEVGLRLRW